MKPSQLLRSASNRPDQRPRARRRLGYSLAIGISVAGGGRYLATVHAPRLHLPHNAMLPLIVTAGIVAIVLGWRLIVFLERRDQHHHAIITGMQNQEGRYQKFEHKDSTYTSYPTASEASSHPAEPTPPTAEASSLLVNGSKTAKASETPRRSTRSR